MQGKQEKTLPDSIDGLISYIEQSGYSFASNLIELLRQAGETDNYVMALCRGVLLSGNPEATYQTIYSVYGRLAA
jgi:hypothetical protein